MMRLCRCSFRLGLEWTYRTRWRIDSTLFICHLQYAKCSVHNLQRHRNVKGMSNTQAEVICLKGRNDCCTGKKILLSYFNRDINLNLHFHQTVIMQPSHAVTITFSTIQNGCTALQQASRKGHQKVVELLLRAGANPDLQDKVRTEWDSVQNAYNRGQEGGISSIL